MVRRWLQIAVTEPRAKRPSLIILQEAGVVAWEAEGGSQKQTLDGQDSPLTSEYQLEDPLAAAIARCRLPNRSEAVR